MIRFDKAVPFVRATLGASPEEAASVLRGAEERHGLKWVALPASAEVEDQRPEWYERHLWPFLSETHFVLSAGDLFAAGCSLLDTSGVDHTPTWRHWGAIVAEWANRHWVQRPAGIGRTRWFRASRPWQYMDFYDYAWLSPLIEGYDDWRTAVWRVLSLTDGDRSPAWPAEREFRPGE